MMLKAISILLLSGGLDSATLLWEMKGMDEIVAITAKYGDSNTREVAAAESLAKLAGVKRHITVDLGFLREVSEAGNGSVPAGVPPTYIPSRNLILFGIAAHYAELIGARRIMTGHIFSDKFPDSGEAFIDIVNEALLAGTFLRAEGGQIISAPYLSLTKKEVARKAIDLGVPIGLTWSCYLNGESPCGICGGCRESEESLESVMRGTV
uniref:7-cyano-7-deazaguanine synthase n=1 Tax=Candidatus Methanomethylicus mesodigestus TaxID=1867258 RepID=A0A7C3EZX8_9CREN